MKKRSLEAIGSLSRLAAATVLAGLLATGASEAQETTRADKALGLVEKRQEVAAVVAGEGADAERTGGLTLEIERLAALRTREDPAAAGPAPAPAAEEPATRPSEDHLIEELRAPESYVRREGVKNPCGPYALTAIMQSYDDPIPFDAVYDQVAPSHNIGSGPQEVLSFLQRNGHRAAGRNRGSFDELAAAVDRGERTMMLINAGTPPTLESTHWVAVKGYKIVNGQRHWIFVDSAFGGSGAFEPGGRYPDGMPEEELAARWSSPVPGVLDALAGYTNYYITVGAEPPGILDRLSLATYRAGENTSTDVLMSAARDVTRGFDDTFGSGRSPGERVGGFFTMVSGGVFKLGLNIPGSLVSAGGHLLSEAGGGLSSWGSERWNEGGLLNRAAGAGATLLGAVTSGAGRVLSGVGGLLSSVAGVAGDLVGGAGRLVGKGIDAIGGLF